MLGTGVAFATRAATIDGGNATVVARGNVEGGPLATGAPMGTVGLGSVGIGRGSSRQVR